MHAAGFLLALLALVGSGDLQADPPGAAPSQLRQGVPVNENPFVGTWIANMSKSKPHPDYPLKAVTVQFDVAGDTVTIVDTHVHASGKETHGTHTFQVDGKEHPFEAPALGSGVVLLASWANSHVLDTVLKKDGKEIIRVIYEVSPDGKTMTATRSGMLAQMAVFERK